MNNDRDDVKNLAWLERTVLTLEGEMADIKKGMRGSGLRVVQRRLKPLARQHTALVARRQAARAEAYRLARLEVLQALGATVHQGWDPATEKMVSLFS